MLTPEKAPQLLGLVRMLHAAQETGVVVRLHACLDTVERESRQGGQDTGSRGADLSPVPLDEWHLLLMSRVLVVSLASSHVCCSPVATGGVVAAAAAFRRRGRRLELRTILVEGNELSWHASWQLQALSSRLWTMASRKSRPEPSKRSRYGQVPRNEVHEEPRDAWVVISRCRQPRWSARMGDAGC